MHDVVGVGITVATILIATFFSNQSVNTLRTELRSEVNGLRSELMSVMVKLEAIQRDMREFYAEQARHDVRLTHLEQNKR